MGTALNLEQVHGMLGKTVSSEARSAPGTVGETHGKRNFARFREKALQRLSFFRNPRGRNA